MQHVLHPFAPVNISLDHWKRFRWSVANRIGAPETASTLSPQDVPIGNRLWNYRGVYTVLGSYNTGRVFRNIALFKTRLLHESGEIGEVWGRSQIAPFPNWKEPGALVWNKRDWRLFRTYLPYEKRSPFLYAEDVENDSKQTLSVDSMFPWYGTIEDFERTRYGKDTASSVYV